MKKSNETAPLVDIKPDIKRLQVEFSTQPLRLAFIVHEAIELEHFVELLEYNSAIWGGRYNCFIPTNGQTIEESWLNNLYYFRPDIMIFCSDKENSISKELLKTIDDNFQPFTCYIWNKWDDKENIVDLHKQWSTDRICAIPMLSVLAHKFETLRIPIEPDSSKILLPQINREHPFYPYIVAQSGIAKGIYNNVYREDFKAKSIDIQSNHLSDYLLTLAQFEQYFTPLTLTRLYANININIMNTKPHGLNIVLAGKKFVHDICLFWNLRLSSSMFGTQSKEIIIPINLLNKNQNFQALVKSLQLGGEWYSANITLH